jgi:peptidoglycan/xylan/chitin deacetylase (PgdA/CDA1 family)
MGEADRFWGLPPGDRVAVGGGPPVAEWAPVLLDGDERAPADLAAGLAVTVPQLRAVEGEPLVTGRLASGAAATLAARRADGTVELAFDPDAAVAALTERASLTPRPPLSARLPFRYRRVPEPLRRLVRSVLVRGRRRGAAGFPAWPVEPSVEVLRTIHLRARQATEPALSPAPFWPEGKRFALVLTHDVDSGDGLRIGEALAAMEQARGLRSTWYVVGRDWPVDSDRLDALRAAGHEIGLHDAHHDNRGPFLDPAQLGARLDECSDLIERHGMRGYRSPSMLRTDALYAALAGRFAYDTSIPDTGLLPAPNGCATVFPIRRGEMPVLPLTLPPDGQLAGMGLDAAEIARRWIAKAEWIARAGGIAMALTHPEPGFSAEPELQRAYERFLDWAAARDDAWHATAAEVHEQLAGRHSSALA